jgi:hypothetical protein
MVNILYFSLLITGLFALPNNFSWAETCSPINPGSLPAQKLAQDVEDVINASAIQNQMQVERIELDQLYKLANLKSGLILHSNDNKVTPPSANDKNRPNNLLSIDAWLSIAREFEQKGHRYHVAWTSTYIHEWDKTKQPPQKKRAPMEESHWRKLIQRGLNLEVGEPAISNLGIPVNDPLTGKPGLRYATGFTPGQPEGHSTELGRKWSAIANTKKGGRKLDFIINSDNFSTMDLKNILRTGSRIELRLNKSHRFNDYDKLTTLLRQIRNDGNAKNFTVRYNGKNLEEFLLDSKEGQQRLRDLLKSEKQ